MSTVTVTDLVPGELPTSTEVNATMTSWNTATAAAAIADENVRMEGIDRRSLSASAHVVDVELVGTNTPIERIVASGNVTSVGAFIVITYGDGTLATTNDITLTAGRKLVVHASLYVRGRATSATASPLPSLRVILQVSTNSGGAWSNCAGTQRVYRVRDIPATTGGFFPTTVIPRVAQSITIAYDATALGVAQRFRVAFQTENDSFNFINGTIWCETIRAHTP